MSLLWIDGFEGYKSGFPNPGNVIEGYNGGSIHGTSIPGRGGVGAKLGVSAGATTRILPPRETIIVGYAINTSNIGGNSHVLIDDGVGGHVQWGVSAINEFYFVLNQGAGSHIVTPVFTIPRFTGAWRYVEVKIKPHLTDGAIALHVDGVEHLNVTGGLQTVVPGSNRELRYRRVWFNASGANYDDYYIADTLGSAPWNDFLGDSRMFIIKPNGPHTTNWIPSTGVNNWDLVNEAETDHADYVESKVLGAKDLYEYEDPALPPGTVIHAIATMTSARRVEEAGPRAIKAHVLSGATEVEGGFHQLSDTWYMEQFILETDPDTGAPWTVAGLDALKAGFEIEV